jgi:hypothetical protein
MSLHPPLWDAAPAALVPTASKHREEDPERYDDEGGPVSYLLWLGPLAYVLLQGVAVWRWRGAWRVASLVPLLAMAAAAATSVALLIQDSNLWPLPLFLASPVALLALLLLAGGRRWAGRREPARPGR